MDTNLVCEMPNTRKRIFGISTDLWIFTLFYNKIRIFLAMFDDKKHEKTLLNNKQDIKLLNYSIMELTLTI
jgi:hypothetical protein